jgi:hypothetical protein
MTRQRTDAYFLFPSKWLTALRVWIEPLPLGSLSGWHGNRLEAKILVRGNPRKSCQAPGMTRSTPQVITHTEPHRWLGTYERTSVITHRHNALSWESMRQSIENPCILNTFSELQALFKKLNIVCAHKVRQNRCAIEPWEICSHSIHRACWGSKYEE